MLSYEFYWKDEIGKVHLIGILPERRRDQNRVTKDSIMNWVNKVIGNGTANEFNNIFFTQVTIE
jgi:hypothetical protein